MRGAAYPLPRGSRRGGRRRARGPAAVKTSSGLGDVKPASARVLMNWKPKRAHHEKMTTNSLLAMTAISHTTPGVNIDFSVYTRITSRTFLDGILACAANLAPSTVVAAVQSMMSLDGRCEMHGPINREAALLQGRQLPLRTQGLVAGTVAVNHGARP
jgi:hypothetical protein